MIGYKDNRREISQCFNTSIWLRSHFCQLTYEWWEENNETVIKCRLPTMYEYEGSRGQWTKTKALLLHTAKISVQAIYYTLAFLDPDEDISIRILWESLPKLWLFWWTKLWPISSFAFKRLKTTGYFLSQNICFHYLIGLNDHSPMSSSGFKKVQILTIKEIMIKTTRSAI